ESVRVRPMIRHFVSVIASALHIAQLKTANFARIGEGSLASVSGDHRTDLTDLLDPSLTAEYNMPLGRPFGASGDHSAHLAQVPTVRANSPLLTALLH